MTSAIYQRLVDRFVPQQFAFMMEIAKNVRDFLVGMKETLSPEEETLLSHLQDLHESYLTVMDDFSVQSSALALSVRPEARMMSHQLRLRLYQDWRAKMMERIFTGSPLSPSPPMKTTPVGPIEHRTGCEEGTCICELEARLEMYKQVVASYLEGSTKFKPKRGSGDACESPNTPDESDDGEEYCFEFPEFLGMAPLRQRLQS